MANSLKEIMMRFTAKDDASGVANSMASNIKTAISSLDGAMANFGQVTDNVMQGLTGKSAMDNILGTSSKAETNKVLLNNMTETKKGAEDLYATVDKVTDSSLTSMQELIPAMKAFKSATGASDKEMMGITDDMANFGAAVLAQTGSTDLAQQSMMDLSKGIKGAFASLDQYGITEESLRRTGYWNGDEKDVEGFMKAVTEVTGSTKELMETNQGLDALIGKAFSRAGKKMGNEFLPQIKDIKRAFLDMDENMGGGLSASILAVSGAIEVANAGFTNVSAIVRGVEDLHSAFSAIKGISKGAKTVSDGVSAASDMGGLAAKAGAAAVEAETTAVATTTLSASFTSMIVPLLALSAVIAIMIPIAAALAVEALLFLKAIQMVFDALDFGGIDLSDDIDGIKQIAEGLAWIGIAMGAMTFANVMTGLAVLTSGLTGLLNPLGVATYLLLEVEQELQKFNAVNIGPQTVDNIKKITEGLKGVGDAMLALTQVTLTTGFTGLVAWVLQFSSITDAMKQAREEITNAAKELAEFTNLPSIDESAIKRLKEICDSLASVGEAMEALRTMRDGVNWDNFVGGLFGGADIQTTLNSVKEDITKASTTLSGFTGLSEIPEGVGKKIKAVADALKNVSESIESLRKLRDDANWDSGIGGIFGGSNIIETLESVRKDMFTVSAKLATLNDISTIPEGASTKIKAITSTLKNVMDTITELNNVKGSHISTNSDQIIQSIEDARVVLYQTSAHLRSLQDISAISEGTAEKIKAIATTAKSVMGAITELNNVQGVTLDASALIQSISDARKILFDTSAQLRVLQDISAIPEGTSEKINSVSTTAKSVMTAVQSLNGIPTTVPDASMIGAAVTAVQTAASELSKLSGITMGEDVNGLLGSINTALQTLKDTLANASGFSEVSVNIGSQIVSGVQSGLSPLSPTVTSAVGSATSSAASKGWTGGAYIGQSTTNGFKSALKLADVMTTEMGHVKSAVDSGVSAAKTAAENGAKEVVEAFKNGINVGSPGDIARTMSGEMRYTLEAINNAHNVLKQASYSAARAIVDSFGTPNLGVNYDDQFSFERLNSLGTIISSIPDKTDNAPVTIIVSEGAVSVDARNYTTKEAQKLMITAFEGMDNITNVDVGV